MDTPPPTVTATADDDNSFDLLLLEIAALARRCARDIVRRQDVEDLAQDVVLECLIRFRNFYWTPEPLEFPGLVRAMVRRRAIDGLRRGQRRAERDMEHHRDVSDSVHTWMQPDVSQEERELHTVQEQALASVSDACRRAYLMVRDEELSYEMVARELGVTRRAVGSHIVRAQLRLVRCLRDYGVVMARRARNGGACAEPSLSMSARPSWAGE